MGPPDDTDGSYEIRPQKRARTSRKPGRSIVSISKPEAPPNAEPKILTALGQLVHRASSDDESPFEDCADVFLPECVAARHAMLQGTVEQDEHGRNVREMTRAEYSVTLQHFEQSKQNPEAQGTSSDAIAVRKLKLARQLGHEYNRPRSLIALRGTSQIPAEHTSAPDIEVVRALKDLRTTPYDNSYLSRLHGTRSVPEGILSIDWDTKLPWIELMDDIREHHTLLHPDRPVPLLVKGHIIYTTLHTHHLPQVHDLLERSFWHGIDVSDSLDYSPEQCTVVATYKKLVVGITIMSSPMESYITYLAVRAGWENARIATSMLYHLINLNPQKDITLHVAADNPAMLLYNRFGFKAEEFVVGFYDAYLDPDFKRSKNAFRLRLRRLQ